MPKLKETLKDMGFSIEEMAMVDFKDVSLDDPEKAAEQYIKNAKARGLDGGKIIKGLPSTIKGMKKKFESDFDDLQFSPEEFFEKFRDTVKEKLKVETKPKAKTEAKPDTGSLAIKAAAKRAYDAYNENTISKIKTDAGITKKEEYVRAC